MFDLLFYVPVNSYARAGALSPDYMELLPKIGDFTLFIYNQPRKQPRLIIFIDGLTIVTHFTLEPQREKMGFLHCKADRRLCFRYTDSTISLLL